MVIFFYSELAAAVDDVSEVTDERAQWPSAVAEELHKVGMDLVKRIRARRITLSTALQRLQQLVDANPAPASAPEVVVERECMMCMSAPQHVRFRCGHSALCRSCSCALHATGDGASLSRLPTASGAGGPDREL